MRSSFSHPQHWRLWQKKGATPNEQPHALRYKTTRETPKQNNNKKSGDILGSRSPSRNSEETKMLRHLFVVACRRRWWCLDRVVYCCCCCMYVVVWGVPNIAGLCQPNTPSPPQKSWFWVQKSKVRCNPTNIKMPWPMKRRWRCYVWGHSNGRGRGHLWGLFFAVTPGVTRASHPTPCSLAVLIPLEPPNPSLY